MFDVSSFSLSSSLSCTCGDVSDLEKGLTNDVERVAKWVEANKLRLNVTKTNPLLMSRKRRAQELQQVNVAVNIQELVRCKKVKCLGVVLDDGLTWKEQVVNVRRKRFAGQAKLCYFVIFLCRHQEEDL